MVNQIQIRAVEQDGEDGIIVAFSARNVCWVCRGRAAAHEAEEEMGYASRVNQSKIDYGSICISSSIVQTGFGGSPSMKRDIQRRDPNRFSRILEARRAQVDQKRLHVEVVPL